MIRRFAAAAALALSLLFAVPAAHAAQSVVHVGIYLENNNHNPGTVTVSCGPMLHTALFNDSAAANTVETAKIYREDGGPANAASWPVVWGPVDVPIGGHVLVHLPYVAGTSYNAVAIPKDDPWPATLADIVGRLTAKPPTADNSQLFSSGYPLAPIDCPTPAPTPSVSSTPNCDNGDQSEKCPTPTPTPTLSKTPTSTPTSSPTTTVSASSSTLPTGTSSSPAAVPTPSVTPAAPGPALAHTGSSVAPLAALAAGLLALGSAAVWAARRSRT